MRISFYIAFLLTSVPLIQTASSNTTTSTADAKAQIQKLQQNAAAEMYFDTIMSTALDNGQSPAEANATATAKLKQWKAAGAPNNASPTLDDGLGSHLYKFQANRTGYIELVNNFMVMRNWNVTYAQELVADYIMAKAKQQQYDDGLRDPDSSEDSSDETAGGSSDDGIADDQGDATDTSDTPTKSKHSGSSSPTTKSKSGSQSKQTDVPDDTDTETDEPTTTHKKKTITITVHATRASGAGATPKPEVTVTVTKHVHAPVSSPTAN